jgi:hypothetical protein
VNDEKSLCGFVCFHTARILNQVLDVQAVETILQVPEKNKAMTLHGHDILSISVSLLNIFE